MKKKLKPAKYPSKEQTSGEPSGEIPDMQKEKIPDPVVSTPVPSAEGRGKVKAAPTTQPAATAAAAGTPTSGNPTLPKLIPFEVIEKAYRVMKPGDDLAVVITSIMAASDENHPETTQTVPGHQNTHSPITETPITIPNPDTLSEAADLATPPPTELPTDYLAPELINFYIPDKARLVHLF